jgi:hypothetical protein
MADRHLWTKYVDTGFATATKDLPLRYLGPGSLNDLYVEYAAQGTAPIASKSTFKRCWEHAWSNVLRRRAPGDFSDCNDCHRLKEAIATARDPVAKMTALKEHALHVSTVAKARAIEEAMRTMPPHGVSTPVLVVMTDGMDQAHWSLPRYRALRAPKEWAKYIRPKCKVQGIWLFFIGVYFFVADATMPHDSNMTIEVIAQALERVRLVCERRRIAMPSELIVWCDNTVRENKNQYVMTYLAMLVRKTMFRVTGMCNLPMGHTHNILDQLYGVLARSMQ